jgi:glycosyltransferase involved in cell wall biosynthesis
VLARDVQAQGVAAERITVIHNGINAAHFAAAPGPVAAKAALDLQARLVLGFTGFVRDWHGVDRVVAWMATVQAPRNAQLLIVGDGPARADLEARARQLGLGDRVAFTGVVARERVPALVAAFDIALQPAVVPYASPLKLLEYLALGKAIVAPREPNLMELLTDADNAVLFDAGAAGALEQALSRLCADAPLRQHLSRGAKATIDRLNLTWDGNAHRVVALAASAGARPERAHAGVGEVR